MNQPDTNQPHTLVLGYLPAAGATRIRKIACAGVIVVAAIYLGGGTLSAWAAWEEASREAVYASLSGTPSLSEIAQQLSPPGAISAALMLAAGLLLTGCVIGIYRDNRLTSYLAQIFLYPVMIFFCAVAAAAIGLPISDGSRTSTPTWLICIPLALLGMALALVAFDIASYLRWLRRHPNDEMPERSLLEKLHDIH